MGCGDGVRGCGEEWGWGWDKGVVKSGGGDGVRVCDEEWGWGWGEGSPS